MLHRGGRNKTRRFRRSGRPERTPPTPGPKHCSPFATTRRSGTTCLPKKVLEKIWARNRSSRGSSGDVPSTEPQLVKALAKELGCSASDGRCLIEKSLLTHREKKTLLETYFRPAMPDGWKSDPDMWLNSDDIATVMKQYERAYPEFKFLGVVPIDFSAPDPYRKDVKKCMNDQFCRVNLAEERQMGRKILGAIFNLDPHYKGGSHWIGLAIDLMRNCVYYFDSYGIAPPQQVARFMRYLTIQEPKLNLQSNGRRFQYSDSECGMYSMYFLIRMIAGEPFRSFCKKRIADKYMLKFRKVLFDSKGLFDSKV